MTELYADDKCKMKAAFGSSMYCTLSMK